MFCFLLLLGSLAYTYKLQTENTETTSKLNSDKLKLQSELEAKIAEYNTAIADNTALKGELEEEQAKMTELLEKLKKQMATVLHYQNLELNFHN